ncbi:hypothetical protein KIPB_001679 [Kipferlia bialata]|uniref:Uncharacterized protein n=1 Tax=Kipferlia bialata TaxID=797122 RepID=A0A9K3GEB3_9EUKA|nr:hypothetical protein KIPB_001679 [Kipferlia bialata]|eukprot:g1679.t1
MTLYPVCPPSPLSYGACDQPPPVSVSPAPPCMTLLRVSYALWTSALSVLASKAALAALSACSRSVFPSDTWGMPPPSCTSCATEPSGVVSAEVGYRVVTHDWSQPPPHGGRSRTQDSHSEAPLFHPP